MKNLSQQIKNSINEDLTQINNRIKGTAFLEILKFKIIDKLPLSSIELGFIEDRRIALFFLIRIMIKYFFH